MRCEFPLLVLLLVLAPLSGFAHGDPSLQIQRLSEALRVHPGDPDILLSRALEYKANGEYGAAIRDLEHAEAGTPKIETRVVLGQIELERGDPQAALKWTEDLPNPLPFGVLIVKGRAAAQLGWNHESMRWFTEALEKDSEVSTVLEAVEVATLLGRTKDAISILDTGIARHQHAALLVERRIQLGLSLGMSQVPLELSARMIQRSPHDLNARWRIYRARAHLLEKRWKAAHRELELAENSVSSALAKRRSPLLLVLRGEVLLELGEDEAAAADFEEAYTRAPNYEAARHFYLKTAALL